jgi:hypothetical protein
MIGLGCCVGETGSGLVRLQGALNGVSPFLGQSGHPSCNLKLVHVMGEETAVRKSNIRIHHHDIECMSDQDVGSLHNSAARP